VVAEASTFATNATVKLVRAEGESQGTNYTSTVQPRERTTESPRVTLFVVLLFLALALPGAGILAWLVIKADTARGKLLVRHRLPFERTSEEYNNKRPAHHLGDERQADWIDDFLVNWRQSLTTQNGALLNGQS
jgi:hypothetical protein